MDRSANEQKLSLVVLDLVAFFAALNASIWFRYHAGFEFSKGGDPPWEEIFRAFPFVALLWVVISAMFGSYRMQRSVVHELGSVFRATMLAFLLMLSATFFYRGFSYSRGMMLFFMPLVFMSVSSARVVFRVLRRRVLKKYAGRARIAVLGRTKIGDSLMQALQRDRDLYEVVGVIDTPSTVAEAVAEGVLPALRAGPASLGHITDLDRLCKEHRLDTIVLVDRLLPEPLVLDSIEACLRNQVTWNMVPGVHDLFLDRARVDVVDGIPLVGMRRSNITGFNWLLKRMFDVLVSALLLIVAGPLMLGVAIAIRLSSRGPVLYVQQRVGYRGQVFPFFKFRSMHVNNDDTIHREYTKRWITEGQGSAVDVDGKKVHKIVGDPRIFSVGRFIRKYSIDELPQLFNVFRGEMSLIGPRPALRYEVDVYREWHRRRFEAPPGITGLWQVSGRNRLTFDEMIKLDIDYLENWSFLRDLHILWRTVRVVLFEHAY